MKSYKLPTVNHESLKNIFSGRNFLRGIKRATDIGLKRYTESQFSVWRKAFSNEMKYFFPNSTTYDTPFSTAFDLEPGQYDLVAQQKLIPLLHYHSHGTPYVSPSEQDFIAHFDIRNQYNHINDEHFSAIENYHLDCIGAIREGGKLHDVLIFQNRCRQPDPTESAFVYQWIRDELGRRKDDNMKLAKTLDSINGWNAHLLTYEKERNTYWLADNQLSGLEKFAYTPALNPGL